MKSKLVWKEMYSIPSDLNRQTYPDLLVYILKSTFLSKTQFSAIRVPNGQENIFVSEERCNSGKVRRKRVGANERTAHQFVSCMRETLPFSNRPGMIEMLVSRREKAKKRAPRRCEKREGQACRRERTRKRRWELRPDRNFNNAP
jgi:hypothetical protein